MYGRLTKLIDGEVIQRCSGFQPSQESRIRVQCTTCPKRQGAYRTMDLKDVAKHIKTTLHLRHLTPRMPLPRVVPSTVQQPKQVPPPPPPPSIADYQEALLTAALSVADPVAPTDPINVDDSHDIEDLVLPNQFWEDCYRDCLGAAPELDSQDIFSALQTSADQSARLFGPYLSPINEDISDDHIRAEDLVGIESLDNGTAGFYHSADNPYYPWPSRAHFLTTTLFSSARVPFSDAQKQAILDWARDMGVKDVPSLYSIKKCLDGIEDLVGQPTKKATSISGNVFYMNDISNAVAMEYANPITRSAMWDYPEDGDSGMSQAFNGRKMLLESPSPPAVRVGAKLFFIDELLQEESGSYFIPERFFYRAAADGNLEQSLRVVYSLGWEAERTEAGFVVNDTQVIIPTTGFRLNYADLAEDGDELACGLTNSSKRFATLAPHPLRVKSQGRMVYNVPLIVFMDDVSGNISKQWNKHYVVYFSNANLPREMMEQEFCIHFVTGSPHASPMELMAAFRESICKAAENGVVAWDCRESEEVLLIPNGFLFAGDNPMQAEMCSQAGLNSNYFCRTCDVGGMKVQKESDEGYGKLFTPGEIRDPNTTMEVIRKQIQIAQESGATDKVKNIVTTTGVRDTTPGAIINTLVEMGKRLRGRGGRGISNSKEEAIRKTLVEQLEGHLCGKSLDSVINPLLRLPGVNIHLDTPTEILHTILLGIVKYLWGQTAFLLEKSKQFDLFQSRLESIQLEGLNAPSLNAEYICHYKGSLIGKHFKSLAQVMPYAVYDLVSPEVLDSWTVVGELVALLWNPEIRDLELYLVKLSKLIEDFLNLSTQCAPSIIITKPKFHFLVHLPLYIRRFGPPLVFSTERNRRAPSRDSCKIFSRQDTVKHITTGGYWFSSEVKRWVHAGKGVLGHLANRPAQARLLGVPVGNELPQVPHGRCQTATDESGRRVRDVQPIQWQQTHCAALTDIVPPAHVRYYRGATLMARNGNVIPVNGHVVFYNDEAHIRQLGRVREILLSTSNERRVEYIAVQLFKFGSTLHPRLHVPRLRLTDVEEVITGKNILCAVNIQHNCVDSVCKDLRQKQLMQERTVSGRTAKVVWHEPTPDFFLNVWSIRNSALISSCLPESLRETPLRVADVVNVRQKASKQVRTKRAAKVKEASSKALSTTDPLSGSIGMRTTPILTRTTLHPIPSSSASAAPARTMSPTSWTTPLVSHAASSSLVPSTIPPSSASVLSVGPPIATPYATHFTPHAALSSSAPTAAMRMVPSTPYTTSFIPHAPVATVAAPFVPHAFPSGWSSAPHSIPPGLTSAGYTVPSIAHIPATHLRSTSFIPYGMHAAQWATTSPHCTMPGPQTPQSHYGHSADGYSR